MNDTYRFGTKYSLYGIEQILGHLSQNTDKRITTYDMVAKKLLDLCQDNDIKEKMKRNYI